MTVGIVGRKSGMTRVFTEDGVSVPVTVVEVVPNRVTQIKEQDTDGYRAIQVTAGNRKASKLANQKRVILPPQVLKPERDSGSFVWMAPTRRSKWALS